MATLSTTGLDKIMTQLAKKAGGMDECCQAMCEAAGDVIKQAWIDTAEKRGLKDSGAMIASIKAKTGKDSDHYAYITARGSSSEGKHKKPVRNDEKAFVLNYKPGKGSGWIFEAEKSCEQDAINAAARVFEAYMK